MGVSWSKELSELMEDPEATADCAFTQSEQASKLNRYALVHIFTYFGSLDEVVPIALVSRWWASLLGEHVVPGMTARMCLQAWYDGDSIKTGRKVAISASVPAPGSANAQSSRGAVGYSGFGSSGEVSACEEWAPSSAAAELLLGSFAFPEILRARASKITAAASARSGSDSGSLSGGTREPWTATPTDRKREPRVVTTHTGRKAVQFVTMNGREPVYLRTSVLPKPLRQPVTIMCVGIAFEDATFLSGVNTRFELCHAYPQDGSIYPGGTPLPASESAPVSMTAHPVVDSSDSDEELNPSFVICGSTQPGQWHVYTAVFNGNSSELYVDGGREGTATSDVGTGWLDGLTIGTDHREDFPLGSTEEGAIPGVLAEMLVFGSVLPAADRVRVERQLMTKHGIELPSLERDRERALEQQANAMLMERAPGRRRKPCPLRYLARHHEMRWSKTHPVTGQKVRPKRIGVRETAESSDWGEGIGP